MWHATSCTRDSSAGIEEVANNQEMDLDDLFGSPIDDQFNQTLSEIIPASPQVSIPNLGMQFLDPRLMASADMNAVLGIQEAPQSTFSVPQVAHPPSVITATNPTALMLQPQAGVAQAPLTLAGTLASTRIMAY